MIREILDRMWSEIDEIKSRPAAKFCDAYDRDGDLQTELAEDIQALHDEATAMLAEMDGQNGST